VAAILGKYERRGVLKSAKQVFARFVGETRLLVKLNQLRLTQLNSVIMFDSTKYVFKHGLYMADAVQLASAKDFELFLTYDKKLAKVAGEEGLRLATDKNTQ